MKILDKKIVGKFGIAIRVVEFSEKDAEESDIEEYIKKYPYWVEHIPLNTDGTYDKNSDCWGCFGGSVGFDTSVYTNLKDAREFFDDVCKLSSEQMIKKYPNLWVE